MLQLCLKSLYMYVYISPLYLTVHLSQYQIYPYNYSQEVITMSLYGSYAASLTGYCYYLLLEVLSGKSSTLLCASLHRETYDCNY